MARAQYHSCRCCGGISRIGSDTQGRTTIHIIETGVRNAYDSPRCRTGPRQPRLAGFVPHLFLRQLLRPGPHGLRRAARDQRRPHRRRPRLRDARAPRHGDHHLRAGRRDRAQGQHGQRLDHPARQRAAHERRPRRDAFRVQPAAGYRNAHAADLDRARRRRHRARVRRAQLQRRAKARPPASPGVRRWHRRFDEDPPGRAPVLGPVRWGGIRRAGPGRRPPRLGPRGARPGRPATPPPSRTKAVSSCRAARTPKCWCSTWHDA
jgi:hypothetical protein